MSVAPDTPAEVLSDLGRGLKAIRDKREEYGRREDYYLGKRKEVITHPKLRTLLDRYGDAFRLNYAAVPVDALADRIDLQGLTTNDPRLDAVLHERLWAANSLDDDADDIHLHAYYLGDYYLIAELIDSEDDDVDDDEDATDDETGTGIGTLELTPKDPFSTVVIYQRSNSRIPDFAVQLIEGARTATSTRSSTTTTRHGRSPRRRAPAGTGSGTSATGSSTSTRTTTAGPPRSPTPSAGSPSSTSGPMGSRTGGRSTSRCTAPRTPSRRSRRPRWRRWTTTGSRNGSRSSPRTPRPTTTWTTTSGTTGRRSGTWRGRLAGGPRAGRSCRPIRAASGCSTASRRPASSSPRTRRASSTRSPSRSGRARR
jgi:hypothetical protein